MPSLSLKIPPWFCLIIFPLDERGCGDVKEPMKKRYLSKSIQLIYWYAGS